MPPDTSRPDETSPLLGPTATRHADSSTHSNVSRSNDHHAGHGEGLAPGELPPTTRAISPARRLTILTLIFSVAITVAIGGCMVDTAQYQLIEEMICDQIQEHSNGTQFLPGNQTENPCDAGQVMWKLTSLYGWLSTVTSIPGLLVSVPYGMLADRYGRTLVMGLSSLGLFLMQVWVTVVCYWSDVFPAEATLASSMFLLIGGGPFMFSSSVYAIASDISTEAQRSTLFFYIGAAMAGGATVARGLTFLAMKQGAWFTNVLGLVIMSAMTVISFSIPETLDKKLAIEAGPAVTSSNREGEPKSALQWLAKKIGAGASSTAQTARWLFIEHKLVGLLMVSLACEILGRLVALFSPIYIRKRYDIPYGSAGLILGSETAISIVLLTLILPGASYVSTARWGVTPREKDLRIAQLSALLAAIGTLIIGLAGKLPLLVVGVVVNSLGGGYTFTVRGLMVSLVGGHSTGLLYSCIAFFETLSSLVAGPLFGRLLGIGMDLGGDWVGLPYLVSGAIMTVALLLIGLIRASFVHHGEPAAGVRENGTREEEGQW